MKDDENNLPISEPILKGSNDLPKIETNTESAPTTNSDDIDEKTDENNAEVDIDSPDLDEPENNKVEQTNSLSPETYRKIVIMFIVTLIMFVAACIAMFGFSKDLTEKYSDEAAGDENSSIEVDE